MRYSSTLFVISSLALTVACSPDRVAGVLPAESATVAPTANRGGVGTTNARSVYQFAPISITGQPVPLSQYRGKKILIVNVASRCGYTPQYTQLEQLSQRYGNRVVVLGFPCNQFGGQEPGNDSTINAFCTGNYNITFPLFSKVAVKGPTVAPLYKFLGSQAANGYTNFKPTWNFCKYLIDENGAVVGAWGSAVTPLSPAIVNAILR